MNILCSNANGIVFNKLTISFKLMTVRRIFFIRRSSFRRIPLHGYCRALFADTLRRRRRRRIQTAPIEHNI